MWVQYMEEIGVAAFIFLFVGHFALYFYFKIKRLRLNKLKLKNNSPKSE